MSPRDPLSLLQTLLSPSAGITSVHSCALLLKTWVPGTRVLTPVQQALLPPEPSLPYDLLLCHFLLPVPLGILRSRYRIHSQLWVSYSSNSFSVLSQYARN